MNPDFEGNISAIEKGKILPKKLIDAVKSCYLNHQNILSYNKPRLLHGDLRFDNIMVSNGKLSGIIDASDSLSGDPMYELGIIHQHNLGRDRINVMLPFYKGYGKVDMCKINFYGLTTAVWLVNFHGQVYKDAKALKKDITCLKTYLSALE